MASSRAAHVEELRRLAARLSDAVEAYAEGRAENPNEIVKQCHVLHHRAESAEVFSERIRYQPLSLCALMIAVEGGMLQALSDRGSEETTADQLAAITSRPKLHIVRALRLLTAIGVCDEAGAERYRANDKTHVMATKGQVGGLRVSSIPVCGITTKTEEYFSKCADGSLLQGGAALPSPYAYTYGKSMYDALRQDKARKADFDAYMEARKKDRNRTWHHVYPAASELAGDSAAAITIVDVGGNRGHDLESFFAASAPQLQSRLRLVLQDLPETVAPLLTAAAAAEVGAGGKAPNGVGVGLVFEPMPYDFFTPQPVKGARLYLLLAVLHNWEDDACRAILGNLAAAMQRGYSRLLISAMLVPETGAERRVAELDVQMWVLQQSRQRTRRELEALVGAAGLEIAKIWDNGDRESILEVRLPED